MINLNLIYLDIVRRNKNLSLNKFSNPYWDALWNISEGFMGFWMPWMRVEKKKHGKVI